MGGKIKLVGMKDGCPHVNGQKGNAACWGPWFEELKPGEVAYVRIIRAERRTRSK